jgi:PAS domain S-box-containing protein
LKHEFTTGSFLPKYPASQIRESIVNTRKFGGREAQDVNSTVSLPNPTVLGLYPEVLRRLPVGIVLLLLEDPSNVKTFRIVDANPAAAAIAGTTVQMLLGRTVADFPKLLEKPIPSQLLTALRLGEAQNLGEIWYGDERIRQRVYAVRVFPLSNNFLGVAFEDVTDRKLGERTLQDNEERLRLLVQGVQKYAIFQLDPMGHVVSWNAGAERLKGYASEEIIGKHFSVFYPREDLMNDKPQSMLAMAARNGQSEDEGWRVRKDGSRFWANVVVTALRDSKGNLLGFAKLTRDMSERRDKEEALTKAKELLELRIEQRTAVLTRVNEELRTEIAERERAEEQLRTSLDQLRALAARLQHVREEERTSISREIHDELGQACTAIKMDLALIGRRLTKKQTQLRAKVDSAMQLVDSTIVTLRRIASELRPRTLDDLGLTAALESQAQEFESRTGIRCRVTLPQEPLTLDVDIATAIFRIFQESLTNVARHAQATRVEARLEMDDARLIFQVSDNGVGFDPAKAKAHKSLGLVGIQERALMLNGDLRIEGVPGVGTTMTLRLPLPRSATAGKSHNEGSNR